MKLLKFEADSCMKCRKLDRTLKTLNVEYTSYDVYADENLQMVDQYIVAALPTLVKTDDNGNEIAKLVGADCLTNKLMEFLK